MSWGQRLLALAFCAAVLALLAFSLRPRPVPPIGVQTAAARQGAITRKVTAAGKLQAATEVKLSSNLSGDLLDLTVHEGDRVKKGQYLGRIDSRRYAAQVRQQEAARASAAADLGLEEVQVRKLEAELARVRRLAGSGNASQAELERAESDVAAERARAQAARQRIAQAEAALAEARHFLDLTTLYAPIDGIVTSRQKQVGERVRGSDFSEDVIVIVATLSSMEAKVEVGEHEVVYLHEGDQAEVEIDAFPDRRWPAQVVEIAKNATIKNAGTEAEVTTFPVRLALTAPVAGALPGMSCQAGISTETHEKAVVVPIQAVTVRTEKQLRGPAERRDERPVAPAPGARARREPTQKVVFVVERGVARARRVETGLASESEIEILDGVKPGETVVEGPYKVLARELEDGKPVKDAVPGEGGKKS
ncbi:efflux RND transporter periplasmic adaptor subunit [Anaeromyxobacter paludicola]|nr:efflux RND transporter periplasmic adaptor subunit [Anaeromyxobacter paludicola]